MDRYESYKDSGEQWLGEIPSHWNLLRSKYLWQETDMRSELGSEQLLSVSQYDGVREAQSESRSESLKGYKLVKENELVINIMLAWLGGLGVSKHEGIVSPAYCVYRLLEAQNPHFLHYLYRTPMYLAEFARHSTGIVPSRWRMYTDDFGEVITILPPIEEQNRMVEYLDKATSKIDEAIAQQQKMIELLNERKQIIINNAVTKGLNPNVPMKKTNLKWLHEIPNDWSILKLKYLASLKGRIGWNGLKSEEFESQSYAYLVTGQDFRGANIAWGKCYQINKKRYDEDPFIQLNNGDLLVTKDGSIGKIAKVSNLDKPACLNSGIFVLKQTKDLYIQDYLYWMLNSIVFKEFNTYNQTGATVLHLYQNVFEQMPCIVPPKEEQNIIASYLNDKCTEIDNAITIYQSKIDNLRERKQIIINDVVTGKVKV